jgi:hypothetical protein
MADWRGILFGGVPLMSAAGVPRIYDADTYPSGPPAECCCPGQDVPCCWETQEERPDQLFATIDVADCCWDGEVVTLTEPGGIDAECLVKYTGNEAAAGCDFGATNIVVQLCCLATPVSGNQWRVVVTSATPMCSPVFTGYANVTSCDPFSITFTGTISAGGLCTECVNGTPITVTITE